jgi:hypothetical protein
MLNLFLVSMFVAFFLALLEPLAEVLGMFTSPIAVNAVFSIGISVIGNILIGFPVKELIIRAVACAFLSRVLLTSAERITTYRPATIRQQ